MKEFPPFRLDTVNQCVLRGDGLAEERVLLAPKAFVVLRYLVEHPGRLVAHEELLDALWPKTYIQPEVLKSHIAAIRAALGDDARKPIFIETMSRRGYRFIAPVTEGASTSGAAASRPAKVLVGRDDALAQLHQCFERMSSTSERQIVFVTGEPGIGKTAVADGFIDWAAGESADIRLARGQCIEAYGSREAYYPMLEVPARARLHRQAAEWAEAAFAEQPSEAAPFLAYHFEHGGDYARAVKYLRVAAQTAGRRYAPREATAHLQHALELSGRLPDSERAPNELAVLEELAAMYLVSTREPFKRMRPSPRERPPVI